MKKTIIYLVSNFTFKESEIRDGDKIRSLNILKGFLDLDYKVYLFSIDNYKKKQEKYRNILPNCNYKSYKSLTNIGFFRSTSFSALIDIKLILEKTNNAYIISEGLHASISTIFLPKKYSERLFLNIVDCNTYAVIRCIFAKLISKNFFRNLIILIERYISEIIISFSPGRLFFVSKFDSEYFKNLFNRKSDLFKNGIQLKPYLYNYKNNNRFFTVIFIGNMATPPNFEARDWIIKQISNHFITLKNKKIKFVLAGFNAAKSKLLKDPRIIKLINRDILNIEDSPKSFEILLQNSDLQICPVVYGTGIKNTVLEGMSIGLPQITTPLIAKPINLKNNLNGFVLNREYFFQNIFSLSELKNKSLLEKISKNNWNFINQNFSWNRIVEEFAHKYLNN